MPTKKQYKKKFNKIMHQLVENDVNLQGFQFSESGVDLNKEMTEAGVFGDLVENAVKEASEFWEKVEVKNEDDLNQIQNNFAFLFSQIYVDDYRKNEASELVHLAMILPIPDPFRILESSTSHAIMVDLFDRPVEFKGMTDSEVDHVAEQTNKVITAIKKEILKEKKDKKKDKKARKKSKKAKEIRELSKLFSERN